MALAREPQRRRETNKSAADYNNPGHLAPPGYKTSPINHAASVPLRNRLREHTRL